MFWFCPVTLPIMLLIKPLSPSLATPETGG